MLDHSPESWSYEELYIEHAPAARQLALSMVPADVADDIVAEASAQPASRDCVLADFGRQVVIGRLELVPPHVGVAALTPGEVGGEVFDMDLHPRPVGGEQVQGHAPFLDDQDGLVAIGGQRDLDDILVLLA
jgi:hypothetical protein